MNITTRLINREYIEIEVEIGNSKHDLGFNNKEESLEMLEMLKTAVDNLEDEISKLIQ
jgi:metallophosphoesterase superfamily enzyme